VTDQLLGAADAVREQAGLTFQSAAEDPPPAVTASWTTACAALPSSGVSSAGMWSIAPSANEIKYRVIPFRQRSGCPRICVAAAATNEPTAPRDWLS
jgi:hypothetical protein